MYETAVKLKTALLWLGVMLLLGAAMQNARGEHHQVQVSVSAEHLKAGKVIYFRGDDGETGRELWKSDGTRSGTLLVKEINPGPASSAPANFVYLDGLLYFSADDGKSGRELWRSDGTAAGTLRVKDINPGRKGSAPTFLTRVGKLLFFRADDGRQGRELWRSDGSTAGTVLVKDINPGNKSATPLALTDIQGQLRFSADDGEHGRTLWISDGTPAGTRPLEQQIASKKTDPARQTEDKRVSQLPAGEDHAHRI